MSQDDFYPDTQQITLPIIGYHRSALSQKFGIPRQPNLVALPSVIEMVTPYDMPEAFLGIEDFSHLWISWHTHHNHLNSPQDNAESGHRFKPKVRPPRLGGNTKLGVFATRSTYRPSQLGLSVVKLVKVEVVSGAVRLHITGADMVDGTPIIDIKPYIAYSDALTDAVSGFAPDKPKLKPVVLSLQAESQLDDLCQQAGSGIDSEDKLIITGLIAQDPRPAYRQQDTKRIYFMRYKHYDIGFQMQSSTHNSSDSTLCIVSITPA